MDEELKRFGVSMEAGLLDKFDGFIREHAYTNRSEAIRDLVRRSLVEEEWAHDRPTVGAIVIVYNHHVPELSQKINNLQHDFPGKVVAAMHVHLDHDNCMEVIVAEGKAHEIKKLCDRLIALRGVLHGTITGSASRSAFSLPREHKHTGEGHTHK
ncbi:MAG TPA: nickel-responsive transcriptional regulator NikR [bacterium]|nr:nickel-responsive transcriptional regulator NikR [bacterium]